MIFIHHFSFFLFIITLYSLSLALTQPMLSTLHHYSLLFIFPIYPRYHYSLLFTIPFYSLSLLSTLYHYSLLFIITLCSLLFLSTLYHYSLLFIITLYSLSLLSTLYHYSLLFIITFGLFTQYFFAKLLPTPWFVSVLLIEFNLINAVLSLVFR